MKGGALTLKEVKERHKLYNKANTKEEVKTRRKHINWINKQVELDNKGVERGEDVKAIWDWVKGELKKGNKIQTPQHLVQQAPPAPVVVEEPKKKYINIETQTNEDDLKEEIKKLIKENTELKEEIKQLKETNKAEEKEEEQPKEKPEPKPLIKGEVEEITINGTIYKKSVQPFRHTEKYYLWDKDAGHLVGIYNGITKRMNKVPKHLVGRKVVAGGNIGDFGNTGNDEDGNESETDMEYDEPIKNETDGDDWMNTTTKYGEGLNGSMVQSIIFYKNKFTKQQASTWLKKHNFKNSGVDIKANTLRYRQEDPATLKKQGYKNYHNKPLGESGITLVLVYKDEKKTGGGGSNNWINYVKSYANKKGISYAQALRDPHLKAGYKK